MGRYLGCYFWILSNRKAPELRGKVILLDARDQWEKMRKSLGDKRKEISEGQVKHVTGLYVNALAVAADSGHPDHGTVKIVGARDFGYQRITIECPLPDLDLRDYENVPLDSDIDAYFERDVRPHVPDAWIDHDKTKVGYEIPFTRHFYVYTAPRPLAEIDAELSDLESQIHRLLLGEVTG